MKSYQSAGLMSLLALVTACGPKPPAPPDAAAIRSALEAQGAKAMAALQQKDSAGLAALFTEDATWILPDASTFKGRADIERGLGRFFASYESITPNPLVIDQLIVRSDTEAFTFARNTYSMTPKGKRPENHTNPFADYWKKGADGVWRIAYEINADGAVPEAAAKRP